MTLTASAIRTAIALAFTLGGWVAYAAYQTMLALTHLLADGMPRAGHILIAGFVASTVCAATGWIAASRLTDLGVRLERADEADDR